MDQGLKERLIGAAVLVVLGVWLIPWVLDGGDPEIETGTTSTALRLPAPEEPLPIRSQTLVLDGAADESADEAELAAEAPRPSAARDDLADAKASTASAAAAPTAAAERDAGGTAAAAPQGTAKADTGEGARTAVASATAPAAQPAKKPAATASASSTAASAPAKPAVQRTDPAGAWLVQLGSFGEEDNARRLAQRIGTFGYKPAVSNHRSGGRSMFRVRVGPYATRSEAEAAASALGAHGFVAQVVAAD